MQCHRDRDDFYMDEELELFLFAVFVDLHLSCHLVLCNFDETVDATERKR